MEFVLMKDVFVKMALKENLVMNQSASIIVIIEENAKMESAFVSKVLWEM